ncbi:MAG TPA: glycosyltransferase family 87 protein [Candidatus Limnocylindrales bacterium]
MTARALAAWKLLTAPAIIGGRRYPPIALVVLAAIGAMFVLVVAGRSWTAGQDEHAYWLAAQRLLNGQPLYDATATSVTPFAYWYPPTLAQVLVPVAAILPSRAFDIAWVALEILCLLWIARWRPLVALALVVFLPITVELSFTNVHLVLAALIVLGLRRWPWAFAIGAAIKIAPGLGILYFLLRRRWRDAGLAIAVGLVILAISVALGPTAWSGFIATVQSRGPGDISGLVPVPYFVRLIVAVVLTVIAGLIRPRIGEPLLVVAITIALPTLWLDAFATLVAILPIVATRAPTTAGESPADREADLPRPGDNYGSTHSVTPAA